MEMLFTILTVALVALTIWCSLIAFNDYRIMRMAKTANGSVRQSDKIEFVVFILLILGALFVLFVHPGLIYQIPSVIAILEVVSLPIMFHMSERQYLDFRAFHKSHVDK